MRFLFKQEHTVRAYLVEVLLVRRGGDRGERGHGAAPLHHEGVALVAAAAAAAAAVPAGRVRAGGGGSGGAGQPRRGGRGELFCKRIKDRGLVTKWQKGRSQIARQRRDGAT